MQQQYAIINIAHWEENIFYPHKQWQLVEQRGNQVKIRRI